MSARRRFEDPVWSDPVTLEHDFTPLAVLNVDYEPKDMEYSKHEGEGIVKGTTSIVASYKEAVIDDEIRVTDVKLSVVRYYNQDRFLTTIQQRMNVEAVWSEAVGDVFLVLAKREDVAHEG